MLRKEKVYTIPEFLELQRAKENTGEYIATNIMKNNKLKSMTTFVLSTNLYCKKAYAASTTVDALAKVNTAGSTFMSIIRTVGYWICILMCIVEILKALMQGNSKAIGNIIIKYLLAFSAFYFMPWLFDLVKDIFL